MRELMSEFKELRLHGMAGAWEELTANGSSRVEASRWLIEHLLQAEHTDRVMRSIGYQIARCQLPWPVGVNYPGRWKRGMMGLAFRL